MGVQRRAMTLKRAPKGVKQSLRGRGRPEQGTAAQTDGLGFSRAVFAGWIFVRELFSLNA